MQDCWLCAFHRLSIDKCKELHSYNFTKRCFSTFFGSKEWTPVDVGSATEHLALNIGLGYHIIEALPFRRESLRSDFTVAFA